MFDPITADDLRRRLDYNPITGRFVWKVRVSQAVRAGDVAGCYDKRTGYIDIGTCGRLYRAHRLAFLYMTGKWPETARHGTSV